MERTSVLREIRNALNVSDELGRHAHARHTGDLAYVLAALRTTLDELDRQVGGPGAERPHVTELARLGRRLAAGHEALGRDLAPRAALLLDAIARIGEGLEHPAAPVRSKRVLRAVPLARWVPLELHTALEAAAAAAALAGAVLGSGVTARTASLALGASALGVVAATDARASAARVVPVEARARFDVGWGLAAMAAPLALGYARSAAGALHVAAGAVVLASALVTDFRAARGLVAPERSRGGPRGAPRIPRRRRATAD